MKSKKGFTIAEVIVSMAMIMIISSAALTVCISYTTYTALANQKVLAVNLTHSIVACYNVDGEFDDNLAFCLDTNNFTDTEGELAEQTGIYFDAQSNCYTIYFDVSFNVCLSDDAIFKMTISLDDNSITIIRRENYERVYTYNL